MTDTRIIYYDLAAEARADRLPFLIGRTEELGRLVRLLNRKTGNNALVVGPGGIGKTAFVQGFARRLLKGRTAARSFYQIDARHLSAMEEDPALEERYREAVAAFPTSVVFIDDFGRAIRRDSQLLSRMHRLYQRLMTRNDVCLVLTLEPQEYAWLEREHASFVRFFETIHLKTQPAPECARILMQKLPQLNRRKAIVTGERVRQIVSLAERYPSLGQRPRSAIRILDESLAEASLRDERVLDADMIAGIVGSKAGLPAAQLSGEGAQSARDLSRTLRARIVDQDAPLAAIAATLQRAKLGLRNPDRPLGSFLLLGPSGVGKTETAKCVAEAMFGRAEAFMRIDMSEFQQEHTVQRLIGAPPGYVGFDEGGALTNALRREPHSLILLDEIEKAHPKVFDIFLQTLDDGRLTSGQNETVDARHAIFMATSNAAVSEILEAHARGEDISSQAFLREAVMPALSRTFRLEFLNRFDSILVFNPLSVESLMRVAALEMRKIERRLSAHRVRFTLEEAVLEEKVRALADPRFGARPVKRFVEETCETLLAESLLSHG